MEKISPTEIKKIEILTESKDTDAIIQCIEKLGLEIEKIGEGGNAEVFSILGESDFSHLCLKKIKEEPQIKNQNIEREHNFQIRAKKSGIRTPITLVSFESEKGSYLIMEKINGYSIRDIAKKNEFLPEEFELTKFEIQLKQEVQKLHNAGIVHRDLNTGNILIDDQCNPVIIDFGTACEGNPDSDWVYEETVSIKSPTTGKYEIRSGAYVNDKESIKNSLIPTIKQAYYRKLGYLQNN